MKVSTTALLLAAVLLGTGAAHAGSIDVSQQDKKFDKTQVTIKAGDSINFVNQDPFFHNIFSLSDAKTFDLGSFPKGESRSITFDQPGVIDVECAIHPEMRMTVTVTK